jgi:hypothetical protein
MPARGQCDSRSPRRGTESALGWRVVVRTLQPPRRGKTSRQGVRLGKRSWGAPSPLAVAPFCDVFQAAAVASLRSRAARRPSSQGQYVSVCAMMLDRDTPKGTALMSWWPTLEWPDARQCEIVLQGASVSSATPKACLVSKPGRSRAIRVSSKRERTEARFRGPAPSEATTTSARVPFGTGCDCHNCEPSGISQTCHSTSPRFGATR